MDLDFWDFLEGNFLNHPKDLDPSYKMDLDFGDCLGRKNLHLITEEIWYTIFLFAFLLIWDQLLKERICALGANPSVYE